MTKVELTVAESNALFDALEPVMRWDEIHHATNAVEPVIESIIASRVADALASSEVHDV